MFSSTSFGLSLLAAMVFFMQSCAALDYYLSAFDYSKAQLFPSTGKPGVLNYASSIPNFSFDVEQTLNIGSQTAGAGAGKITFNPLTITRNVDQFSPLLFQRSAAGTPFQTLTISVTQSASQTVFMSYIFSLAAVKSVSYASADSGPVTETITFEYGGLELDFTPMSPQGTLGTTVAKGWNRVNNIACTGTTGAQCTIAA